ncbi:MAG: hypothetical protein QXX95_07550 [Nitrososphaerales archaeon]
MQTKLSQTLVIPALLILILASVVPALAQTITVTTDKDFYAAGESLIVSGTVSPVVAGQQISIQVLDPANNVKAVDQITPSVDGSYSKSVYTFSTKDPTGDWKVSASYMGKSAEKSFSFGVAPITIQTDKAVYAAGDKLTVSGKVSRIVAGQQIAIQVIDPLGSIKAVDQVAPSPDLTYSRTVMTFKLDDVPGPWTVKASYLGQTASATFTLVTDTEKPSIVSVRTDKNWYKGGASISIAVVASDNVGVTSVKATLGAAVASLNLVAGTAKSGSWVGTLTAPAAEGKYTIKIEAIDAGKNSVSTEVTINVDNTAPVVTIAAPKDGSTSFTSSVSVEGTVLDNSNTVKSVTIDGKSVDLVDGAFKTTVVLKEGPNVISVTAYDEAGNIASKGVSVNFKVVQLIVQVVTAENYNPGDKARIFVATVLSDGTLVNAEIATTHLYRPDGQLISTLGTATTIHPGWRFYEISIPDITGTYGIHIVAKFEGLTAHGWWKFEVRPAITPSIEKVSTQVAEVSAAVKRVDSALGDLSRSVSETQASVSALKSDLDALKASVSSAQRALEGQIAGLRDSVNSALSDIRNSLSGKIDASTSALGTALSNEVNKIKASLDEARSGVAQVATNALIAAIAASISAVLAIAILVIRRR